MTRMWSHILFSCIAVALVLAVVSGAARADYMSQNDRMPLPLEHLKNLPKENKFEGENEGLPLDIRRDAMKEAALSYGARGGLAWRTYHIRRELDANASYMDKVFNFGHLLITAPSGLLIEPPVVSEAINAMIIEAGGQAAAVSDRVYDINKRAKIVSTPKSWRNYLEREWGEVTPPPDILRPSNETERDEWIGWVEKGWERGVTQANEIFEADINQLVSHYQGMVRYRLLLRQGMISAPYAMLVDRGITGGGKKMRVGDRAVQITGQSQLIPKGDKWQPANR